jgi:hypothetical protein
MTESIGAYHKPRLTAEALAKEVTMHSDFNVGRPPALQDSLESLRWLGRLLSSLAVAGGLSEFGVSVLARHSSLVTCHSLLTSVDIRITKGVKAQE